jgi:glycosyltransferase involved in cell wall biosynthesis
MELAIIVSTYNSPEWLEKVLWGYQWQSFRNFELYIADDGSTKETADLITEMKSKVFYPIHHIWHEDKGFRKCTILNKAIEATASDYIVFSDGDCIPRADFLAVHYKEKKDNYFLSGGYFKLPMDISKAITLKDIEEQKCFAIYWLMEGGLKKSFKNNKLTASGFKQWLLNNFTTTKATWNGHNASGWKKDILAVNGFDERMRYGGEDREMGERMMNKGIIGKQVRYSAICLHLDHPRGYVNEADLKMNSDIRKITKKKKITWTDFGIKKN